MEELEVACRQTRRTAAGKLGFSIVCHFHGPLWKSVSQGRNHREGPFWGQEPLGQDADCPSGSKNPDPFIRTHETGNCTTLIDL
jgi:hypothetical protein